MVDAQRRCFSASLLSALLLVDWWRCIAQAQTPKINLTPRYSLHMRRGILLRQALVEATGENNCKNSYRLAENTYAPPMTRISCGLAGAASESTKKVTTATSRISVQRCIVMKLSNTIFFYSKYDNLSAVTGGQSTTRALSSFTLAASIK